MSKENIGFPFPSQQTRVQLRHWIPLLEYRCLADKEPNKAIDEAPLWFDLAQHVRLKSQLFAALLTANNNNNNMASLATVSYTAADCCPLGDSW